MSLTTDHGLRTRDCIEGESSGVTGGYVVPPDFYQQLLAIATEAATLRQRAFVQPMASATPQFLYLDITTVQSAGNSPFFGGVIASWTGETQTRQATEPQFKMMELKALGPGIVRLVPTASAHPTYLKPPDLGRGSFGW